MLKQISANVLSWSEIHGAARNEPYLWNSHIIPVPSRDVLVLIDPLPLSVEDAREIEAIGKPSHILMTCNYHFRESAVLRQKWGCEIWLHQDRLKDSEAQLDGTFQDGDVFWDTIEVIHVPDVYFMEEVAFLARGDGNTMIVGDLMCGGRKDRGVPDGSIWISGPEYIADLQEARSALRKVGEHSFEKLCFAHGTPIAKAAKDVFDKFVESDDVWAKLGVEQAERASPHSREFLKGKEACRSR